MLSVYVIYMFIGIYVIYTCEAGPRLAEKAQLFIGHVLGHEMITAEIAFSSERNLA